MIAFIAGAAVYGRVAIATKLGAVLVRDDHSQISPSRPPYAMLLMGDHTPARADAALSLYRQGLIKKIILVREEPSGFIAMGLQHNYSEVHYNYLLQAGVPSADLVFLSDCIGTSTRDEADCALAFLGTLPAPQSQLALITSWYHTSRASWIFERRFAASGLAALPIIAAVPATSATNQLAGWWTAEGSFLAVFNEYLKWAYWLARATV